MIKQVVKTLCLLLVVVGLGACSSDDNSTGTEQTLTTFVLNDPEGFKIEEVKQVVLTLKELNSGNSSTIELKGSNKIQKSILSGTYDISIEGTVTYKAEGTDTAVEGKIASVNKGVIINGLEMTKTLNTYIKGNTGDFVIEEIFFTGTKSPEGEQYDDDKYIKITNNTEEVLYIDGLLLVKSKFMTNEKEDYQPLNMNADFYAEAILQFPGSGKDYPVEPGKSIIFAEYAINHQELNANSIDLSKADFEKYFESNSDVNNPQVTDLINIYDQLVIHNQGYFAYALVRLPEGRTADIFNGENLDYVHDYSYDFVFGDITTPMPDTAIKIPNEYVIDVVNLGVEESHLWNVTSPSLDMGYAYVSKFDDNAARYGKSVRRKVIGKNSKGLDILMDTNNSSVDFQNGVKASLLK